ncbi:hypothetical protein E8F11_19930 [Pseudomonas sp. BN417]|nr:hypothetical protein [Pseudomonas sp. BN417]
MDKTEAIETFDEFLMLMDGQIDWLTDEAKKNNITLDNKPDTPEKLEKLFDAMSKGLSEEDKTSLIIIFGRYLGEFVRLSHGGKWVLPLDDEKSVNFNIPVITGHSKIDGLEFAPIRLMRAYALRDGEGTLRRAIENHINPQALDPSKEIAQEDSSNKS